jgi:hypothetical protein
VPFAHKVLIFLIFFFFFFSSSMALQPNLGLGIFNPPTPGSILCRHAHKVTSLKLAGFCEEFRAISLPPPRHSTKMFGKNL